MFELRSHVNKILSFFQLSIVVLQNTSKTISLPSIICSACSNISHNKSSCLNFRIVYSLVNLVPRTSSVFSDIGRPSRLKKETTGSGNEVEVWFLITKKCEPTIVQ